jgi:hypothetical protein
MRAGSAARLAPIDRLGTRCRPRAGRWAWTPGAVSAGHPARSRPDTSRRCREDLSPMFVAPRMSHRRRLDLLPGVVPTAAASGAERADVGEIFPDWLIPQASPTPRPATPQESWSATPPLTTAASTAGWDTAQAQGRPSTNTGSCSSPPGGVKLTDSAVGPGEAAVQFEIWLDWLSRETTRRTVPPRTSWAQPFACSSRARRDGRDARAVARAGQHCGRGPGAQHVGRDA